MAVVVLAMRRGAFRGHDQHEYAARSRADSGDYIFALAHHRERGRDGDVPLHRNWHVCAMDDGIMNAYVHYLLVRPEYQGKGIGKILVDKVHEIYKDYLRIVVVAYNEKLAFYEHCGFKKADDASAMFITSLWT